MKLRIVDIVSRKMRAVAERLIGDRRGAVGLVYAMLMFTMLLALGVGADLSNALQVEYRLDLAADAGAIACGEAWQSTMEAGAGSTFSTVSNQAVTISESRGQAAFLAQAEALGNELVAPPTVTALMPAGYTAAGGAEVTCTVTYKAYNPNYIMKIAGFWRLGVSGSSQTTVKLPPYVAVYIIVDTSSSMMVGSNPQTQYRVSSWSSIYSNYCMVWADCATNPGETPCGFACHDYGHDPSNVSTTKISQMLIQQELGEQVAAYEAGQHPTENIATRFDVMRAALVNDPNPPSVQTAFCTQPSATPPSSPKYTLGSKWPASRTPPPVVCSSTLGEGLLAYIRNTYQATEARISLNTFTYSLYGFNYGINGKNELFSTDITDYSQYAVPNAANQATNPYGYSDISKVAAGVNNLMVGIDTHLNDNVLPQLQNIVGTTNSNCAPAGACSDNPLKFVIIITDGLMSDRDKDWQQSKGGALTTAQHCQLWNPGASNIPTYPASSTPSWRGQDTKNGNTGECSNNMYTPGFISTAAKSGYTYNGGYAISTYASPIDYAGACATMKANGGNSGPLNGSLPGVTIAVLETPYVPMTGQQPNTFPYEGIAQQTIYPNGPNTTSELTKALKNCATSADFYFQATADSSIATGFQQLFNTYVGQWVHLTQ